MRELQVSYRTQVPDAATDEEIQSWLEYTLTERGELSQENSMAGCGPEPFEKSISFSNITAAVSEENNTFCVRISELEQEIAALRSAAQAILDDPMSDCRKSLAEQLQAALGALPPSTPYVCDHGYAYSGSIMCVQCATDVMTGLEQRIREDASVLQEFVSDVKAMGDAEMLDDPDDRMYWPDLIVTYRKALKLLRLDDENQHVHIWITPNESAGGFIPVGYPRCIKCGVAESQAQGLPCPENKGGLKSE